MKCALVLLSVIAVCFAADNYGKIYENAKDVLQTDTLAYVDCFLGRVPCDETSAAVEKVISVVIKNLCENCNAVQKAAVKEFYDELESRTPKDFEEYKQKYDPSGKGIEALRLALADA